MKCDAHLRWGHILLDCLLPAHDDPTHEGVRYQTIVTWDETDRRNYHGADPGRCFAHLGMVWDPVVLGHVSSACILPAGHRGDHAP